MFPPCVQNIYHNLSANSLLLSAATTGLLLMSSVGKDKVKASAEGERDKSKDKGQHKSEKGDTADSGKVISAERSDSLVGPNWINVITNMLCLYE